MLDKSFTCAPWETRRRLHGARRDRQTAETARPPSPNDALRHPLIGSSKTSDATAATRPGVPVPATASPTTTCPTPQKLHCILCKKATGFILGGIALAVCSLVSAIAGWCKKKKAKAAQAFLKNEAKVNHELEMKQVEIVEKA